MLPNPLSFAGGPIAAAAKDNPEKPMIADSGTAANRNMYLITNFI